MRIAIFTDDPGWHGAELQRAFAKKGVEAVFVSLNACAFQTDIPSGQREVILPNFQTLPDAVFVRGIAGGTLPQVISRLNILHILAHLGVQVYNQPRAIERTVDKAMTSFLLQQAGVASPATWVCESRTLIEKLRTAEPKQTFVLKPLFGSQGVGIRLLTPDAILPVPMMQHVDGVYYLQAFIASTTAERTSHDYRVFVIDHEVVACMRRHGAHFIHNVAAGAYCEQVTPPQALIDIALAAAKAMTIDYCGVDIIQAADGQFLVLEVNSIPAWRGLQNVTDLPIAGLLVDDFLQKVTANKSNQHATC